MSDNKDTLFAFTFDNSKEFDELGITVNASSNLITAYLTEIGSFKTDSGVKVVTDFTSISKLL